jgi:hypothetical protein
MNDPISMVGSWQGQSADGVQYNFHFTSDGLVTWEGKAPGKAFRCTGAYHLDTNLTPAVLQVTDVAIRDIQVAGQIPVIEKEMVMQFYQEFDGESVMRMQGMPMQPKKTRSPHKISDDPDTLVLKRL